MSERPEVDPGSFACELRLWVPDVGIEEQPWRGFSADVTAFCDDDSESQLIGHVSGCLTFSPDEELIDPADAISDDSVVLATAAEDAMWDETEIVNTVMLVEMVVLERPFRGQGLAWKCIAEVLRTVDARSALVTLQPEPQQESGGPYRNEALRGPALARLRAAWADYGFRPSKDSPTMWRSYDRDAQRGTAGDPP